MLDFNQFCKEKSPLTSSNPERFRDAVVRTMSPFSPSLSTIFPTTSNPGDSAGAARQIYRISRPKRPGYNHFKDSL